MIAVVEQSLLDLLDVLKVLGFKQQPEVASVDVGALIGTLVVNGNNIAAEIRDNIGNALQLAGLVDQLQNERTGASGHEQTSLDDAGENGNVDIAA